MTEIDKRAVEIATTAIDVYSPDIRAPRAPVLARRAVEALMAAGYTIAPPCASVVDWRPEVIAFASAMEERLQKCEAMADVDTNDLLALIYDEATELEEQAKWYPQDIYLNSVAVRLALCSMLVTNKLGRLSLPTPPKQGGA